MQTGVSDYFIIFIDFIAFTDFIAAATPPAPEPHRVVKDTIYDLACQVINRPKESKSVSSFVILA